MGVEEHQPGHVRTFPGPTGNIRIHVPGEQRVTHAVPRQYIGAAAQHDRGSIPQHVQQLPGRLRYPLGRWLAGAGRTPARSRKIVQVPPLRIVQPQRSGERVKHLRRRAQRLSLLQSRVIGGAHPRQQRDFLAPQARHTPAVPVGRYPGILRTQLGSSRLQEITEGRSLVHASSMCQIRARSLTQLWVGNLGGLAAKLRSDAACGRPDVVGRGATG